MTQLHELSASELLAGYRSRQISPVDALLDVLSHVARWEPHLQATYLLRPEAALAQARQSEARWLRGAPCGPLDGVPVTLKDNIATQGDPTPLGTAALPLVPAAVKTTPLTVAGAPSAGKSSLCVYVLVVAMPEDASPLKA